MRAMKGALQHPQHSQHVQHVVALTLSADWKQHAGTPCSRGHRSAKLEHTCQLPYPFLCCRVSASKLPLAVQLPVDTQTEGHLKALHMPCTAGVQCHLANGVANVATFAAVWICTQTVKVHVTAVVCKAIHDRNTPTYQPLTERRSRAIACTQLCIMY